ncbi:hypothetical protein LOTGIDRAFT_177015 [Lottia gigantea]|uniref:Uncharacterized protein n=1 Tax=Lottia gigantea TaxID=225164 RepID=V4B740_LOTGI|nr:hypothetical protein LOTGIDRAFT_177015 [Lottia gigantea]ESP03351.1 hypothetical protein LOTGIDRAFT_177015 [Lottia gigantea]
MELSFHDGTIRDLVLIIKRFSLCFYYILGKEMELSFHDGAIRDLVFIIKRFSLCFYYFQGKEMELSFHDGTIRDLVFMQDATNKTSILISGGAGDCKNYVTDCVTGTPIRAMAGHSGELTKFTHYVFCNFQNWHRS